MEENNSKKAPPKTIHGTKDVETKDPQNDYLMF
jgi:hypothetical protein